MTAVQVVNVRAPLSLLEAVQGIADRQHRSRHATIILALEQYVNRNTKATPENQPSEVAAPAKDSAPHGNRNSTTGADRG